MTTEQERDTNDSFNVELALVEAVMELECVTTWAKEPVKTGLEGVTRRFRAASEIVYAMIRPFSSTRIQLTTSPASTSPTTWCALRRTLGCWSTTSLSTTTVGAHYARMLARLWNRQSRDANALSQFTFSCVEFPSPHTTKEPHGPAAGWIYGGLREGSGHIQA